MKKLLLAAAVAAGSLLASEAKAQISVSINIGQQPSWGPTGYDHVEYYYIPDIQAYYYVPNHQFVYLRGGHWTFSNDLPSRYRNFDLYHCHKEVINEPQAYLHYDEHRAQFDHFRGDPHGQVFIRDSREDRYRDHWHDQHEANEEWRHRPDGDRHWGDGDRGDHGDHGDHGDRH
jgi:hypothetical protein